MKKQNWKNRDGVVYSTSSNFEYEYDNNDETDEDLAPNKQNLRVQLDKKQRAGKTVTLVTGYVGSDDSIKELGRRLKSACGVGGSVKDGEILVQGDFREKITIILQNDGFKVKRIN